MVKVRTMRIRGGRSKAQARQVFRGARKKYYPKAKTKAHIIDVRRVKGGYHVRYVTIRK